MTKRQFITELRWLCVVPAALVGAVLTQVAYFGLTPLDPRGTIEPEIAAAILGGCSAAAFVLAGCFVAPNARRSVTLSIFALGACLAFLLMWGWTFPEGPRSYQTSRVPFWGTIAGGIVGVALVEAWVARQRRRAPGPATAPDPAVAP